ncbi:MAG: cadmium-translocating P-type ATPase [Acholeplasmatales bacterium]|nr:cadmium-translocating P-type ATPase [Acholeplasmatales bacterium]
MNKKQKKKLIKILITLGLFLLVFIPDIVLENAFNDSFPNGLGSIINNQYGWLLPFFLYFAIYLFIGIDVLKKFIIHLKNGQVLDEDFLMTVATIGALGLGIYTGITKNNSEGADEACAVMILFLLGEWFESFATNRSRNNIKELMNIAPEYANLVIDGKEEVVLPNEVKIGSIILVKPGEKVPLDGVLVEGKTTLDMKALTGEALPKDVFVGDDIISGSINLISTIKIKTTKEYSNSTVAKILDLVENASNKKSKSEAFISKFAKYYTPIVVILALLIALVPPLIIGFLGDFSQFPLWIYRALSFLVVSCPCALVISVPMAFFISLGFASKKGILIKGSVYLEALNKANTFVFDKTGTLTKGNFKVTNIYSKIEKEELLHLAAIAEKDSIHPIALAIKEAYGKDLASNYSIMNVSGMGIIAKDDKNTILCGNEKLMTSNNIEFDKTLDIGSIIYVALNNEFVGSIVIEDEIKDESKEVIGYLNGINAKTIMLTGDNENVAKSVKEKLNLASYRASLLPKDKVDQVSLLLEYENNTLCYLGDGINDAPVLMASDVGIAMGALGSDAAIEASDIVFMNDDLSSLIKAKRIAKKTMRIVYENIIFALLVKITILVLSALGITNMWVAIFGDVGVAILCILNAMRNNMK